MKKFAVFLSMVTVCLCIGCNRNETDVIPELPVNVNEYIYAGSEGTNRPLVNEAAIEAAFTLDYRPLKAEPENEVEILSAASLSGAVSTGGGGRTEGGGLRQLSDYKTVYLDPVRESGRIQAIRAAQEAGREGQLEVVNNEALTVVDWGPRGDYSSAIQRPSIHVIFSQPMIPLSSLGETSSTSPVVSITPAIKGSFRWYGTSFLSFEGEEPCQSQQAYTITVANNAASIYGNRISGDRTFSFYTETLSIKSVTPGEEFRRKTNFRFDNNNVPPEAAGQIGLEFNYPVRAVDINQYLEITAAGVSKRFNLKQENEYKITLELLDPVDFDTQVRIILKVGARSQGASRGTEADQTFSFRTPGPFRVTAVNRWPGYGRYKNLVEINFSHALNESTVRNAVRTEPAMTIGNDNIEIQGNILRLYNLPVSFGDRFTLTVAAGVEDVFGRKLSEPYSANIVMPAEPPPQGQVNFPDYRRYVMLEAQFPPRYLFEYRNITEYSRYLLSAKNNPWNTNWDNASLFELLPGTANTRYFEEIDLSPYLNKQGKGFVSLRVLLNLLTSERQRDDTYRTRTSGIDSLFNIQVTDLGLTVRYGFNRVVVLVTSISTGKPVEGAQVTLLPPQTVNAGDDLSVIGNFVEAVTGSNGLAVLNMGPSVLRLNTANRNSWQGFDTPFVMAEKDGDRAVFNPSSHNNWSFGVQSGIPQRAEEITPLAFLFSDRGLYKPGEVLTFRGVDRSNVLGMYTIYQGDYLVVLEENTYRPKQVTFIKGVTTESGSFYGSINIPEDLNPGSYRLV
ncbi:MAG: hypothetical protein LBQ89_09640, partial [Treponema sp.]|nr:hypothetical protein [Treponema sp.]